ncbi:MAG: DUF2066 domain-containing protein [Pseudomonadota bacterium]|nr:DUF2066 domain-containing protein [Pseudomonadota bacterium]
MTQYLRRFSKRYLRSAALLGACIAGLCLGEAAFSLNKTQMYQASAPVTDRSEAAQTAAFQNAMRTVLIRVTGRRSAGEDAALSPLISNARRYVQQYRTAADSQLWVAFDGPAIERWLTQNGQPLWGQERPTTLVLLAVQSGAPNGTVGNVVTTDDTSELKAAIDAAAYARGLPLVWPSAAELQKYHIDLAALISGSPSAFTEIGRRMGSDALLLGRAGGTAANATVRWTHLFHDRSSEYSGTLEGVNRAADLYAGLFAASGSLLPVDIEVVGINDLRDYASVENYLESLTFISHVSVESMGVDTVRFRLATRGGSDSLQRALSLNGRLQPVAPGETGIQRFQLHR